MDQTNLFETRTTSLLHRAEYMLLFLLIIGLFVAHIGEVRWWVAVLLFVYIDVIGYIPGAIAHHRSETKRIPKTYYILYNTMHSIVTQTLVVLAWGVFVGWEWALLVIPFHLFGDRALFGNYLKPFALSFEPVVHPAFARLRDEIEADPYAGTTDTRSLGTTAPGVAAAVAAAQTTADPIPAGGTR